MILKEITYSKGQTVQIRQYEPCNVHYSIKAELDGTEGSIEEAYKALEALVDHQVEVMVTILQKPQQVVRAKAETVIKKDHAVAEKLSQVPF